MAKRKPTTLLELAIARYGVRRGGFAAGKVACWVIATNALGHVPTTVEYADYWGDHERTGWAHRAAVQDLLGDEWPAIVEALAAQVTAKMKPGHVQRLPLPAALVAA